MGLFEKKFCDICGDKVNLLTKKKLSDGQLCSDCKQKLGSFTSGWKQRTVQDVKAHLEQREQNKQKYQQFNCTAAAGGRNSTLQADFNHRWFIFAVDNRDFRSGNPQVFEFSQLQDFWIEPKYRTLNDSDNDGIPDNRDDFDNRQLNNQGGFGGNMNRMNNMMNTSMLNIPLAAQPFVRNSSSCSSPNEIREVSNIRVCFRVTDLYITNPIGFDVTSGISSGNQMELMNAYETAVQVMQLCQQIKQDGASVNQGYSQMNQSYGQPQQNMGGFAGNTVQNVAYTAAASAQIQNNAYNNAAPVTPQTVDASWICSSCGTRNEGKFCQGCGCAKPAAMPSRCPSCGWTPANGQPMLKFCPECGARL